MTFVKRSRNVDDEEMNSLMNVGEAKMRTYLSARTDAELRKI